MSITRIVIFYVLSISHVLNAQILTKPGTPISSIECGDIIEGSTDNTSLHHFYSFTVYTPKYIRLSLCDTIYPMLLYLWNQTNQLYYSSAICPLFRSSYKLTKGNYTIGITGYDDHTYGYYKLSISCDEYQPFSDANCNLVDTTYVCECIGYYQCDQSPIVCLDNYDCSIICDGSGACYNANIVWPINGTANITCNEFAACSNIDFTIPSDYDFEFFCTGDFICTFSTIHCPLFANCLINCIGQEACRETNIIWSPHFVQSSLICNGSDACLGVIKPPQTYQYYFDDIFVLEPTIKNVSNSLIITKDFEIGVDIKLNDTNLALNNSNFNIISVKNDEMTLMSISINNENDNITLSAFSNLNTYVSYDDIFKMSDNNEYHSINLNVLEEGTIIFKINNLIYINTLQNTPALSTLQNNKTYSLLLQTIYTTYGCILYINGWSI